MKFRLRHGHGQSAAREIGSYLRSYGSGHHWVERFRGDVFVHPGDKRDENILRDEFSHVVESVEDTDKD